MKCKATFLLFFALLIVNFAFAQRIITGTVTNAYARQLFGVTIIVANTQIGTVTDIDGKYSIQLPPKAKQLQLIYFTGYTGVNPNPSFEDKGTAGSGSRSSGIVNPLVMGIDRFNMYYLNRSYNFNVTASF